MSASPPPVPLMPDDALSLVQAQYEVSGVIFGSDDAVDVLEALHRFTGNQFSSAHLAQTYGDNTPVTLRVVAEGGPGVVRVADRLASLDDYPAIDMLTRLEPLAIPDLSQDTTLSQPDRERLRARGLQAALVVPVAAQGRMSGLIVMMHNAPVTLSAARLRALANLADQLGVVLDNRRLLAAAQATALQEQTINALVARFQAAGSIDELLRMTLTELGGTLGASSAAIRLSNADGEGQGDSTYA